MISGHHKSANEFTISGVGVAQMWKRLLPAQLENAEEMWAQKIMEQTGSGNR